MKLKAFIFDMDGTIVDSKLDFKRIRKDCSIPEHHGILEYVSTLSKDEQVQAFQIIHQHEKKGALESEIMRDFLSFYKKLKAWKIPIGLQTRNSKEIMDLTLKRHKLDFDIAFSRDCIRPKPNPDGINYMLQKWHINKESAIYIGDSLDDVSTAKSAGIYCGLISQKYNLEVKSQITFYFNRYEELEQYALN